MKFSLIAGLSLVGSAMATQLPPIVTKGNKFFYSNNGTEFYIRGVAYQENYNGRAGQSSSSSYTDPLADITACQRDIPWLVKLRTNVIRTYAVDPTKNHDACMQAFADAGIYLITDLASPTMSISQQHPSWNTQLFTRYTQVVDAFAKYPNVIGFFVGNEVSNAVSNTDAMAYVKAAARDMKSYIQQKNYRSSLSIGYAADDDATIRANVADYLVCGTPANSIDMFGFNIYEWCGQSSYETSGYEARTNQFKNYPVPAFFSEYGCVQYPQVRTFTDVPVLYGPLMNNVWSGGIVYMYFETSNHYGLVKAHGNSVSPMPNYFNLESEIQKATPSGVQMNAFSPTTAAGGACPTEGSNWHANSVLPPSPNAQLCSCMESSLSCVPKPGTSQKNIQSTFNYLFGVNGAIQYVAGVNGSGTTGEYGAYSMCSLNQRLAFAMNRYYEVNGKAAKDCNFAGVGQIVNPKSPGGSCSSLMQAAGTAGTGTLSGGIVPSATAGSGSGASSSGAAIRGNLPQAVYVGTWQMGAYMVAAAFTGVAMIML